MTHHPSLILIEPVFDDEWTHIAERAFFTTDATSEDQLTQSARACCHLLYETGLDRLVGNRPLWLDLGGEWLAYPELWPAQPERLRIILPADDSKRPGKRTIQRLRSEGYRLGMHLAADELPDPELLDAVDLLLVHGRRSFAQEAYLSWRQSGGRVAACGIDSLNELNVSRGAGCDLFSGRCLEQPVPHAPVHPGRHGNPNIKLRLFSELYRVDVSLESIERYIIQYPYLHASIIKLAHSSYFQPPSQPLGLRQAIMVIGLRELRVLVATLLLAYDTPRLVFTLRQALVRGFMCRALARPFASLEAEHAFSTGFFSLMDRLLQIDQQTLLVEIPLHDDIIRALRERRGEQGALLTLVEEYETLQADAGAHSDELAADQLRGAYLEAVAQTQALMALR
ncbi:c-di-GMP-related signal transduction protein [Halomonas ventosae]|uniref:C-di-GMP-related signal transduction protein n=1 Tax=Halomonas ventosae TaxID=229007 RepID=A0A4R6ZTS5_9GAMM|nr:HDOD domain-containing protein [Halomonas ventosae]TDR56150.1 c-di-GMP-related signal transduction protein [Halomonas ventosae]